MPSESSCTQRHPTTTTKVHPITGCTPPPEPEHLPCPRCDSTNTKFCYYNNYNFSQPRHFCKACRRYWTHGGTLRDIPIGGGSRKNAKRSRLTSNHNPNSTLEFRHMAPPTATPILIPFAGEHGGGLHFLGDGKPMCKSFTSLLNNNTTTNNNNNMNVNVNSHGVGLFGGFEDGGFGFGIGRGVWPFSGVGDGGHYAAVGGGGGNTWQMDSGEHVTGGGECFTLPDLAISTPGMI